MEQQLSTRQWLFENIHKFNDDKELIKKCCVDCDVTRKTVLKRLNEVRVTSKSQLLQCDDIRKRLCLAIDFLGDNIITDNAFRLELEIGNKEWTDLRNLKEFSDFHITIKGKIVWGKPKTLKLICGGVEKFYIGDQ